MGLKYIFKLILKLNIIKYYKAWLASIYSFYIWKFRFPINMRFNYALIYIRKLYLPDDLIDYISLDFIFFN